MEEPTSMKRASPREQHQSRRRSWCCSFSVPPSSPENLSIPRSKAHHSKSEILSKLSNSVPNSPQSSKSGLGIVSRIDPRRILSPGRVSPIDSDPTVESIHEIGLDLDPSAVVESPAPQRSESFRGPIPRFRGPPECSSSGSYEKNLLDVRLNLKGKNGGHLVLELNSNVLSANSEMFAGLISEYRKGLSSNGSSSGAKICRIEVPEVENLGVFRETIELMFEDDITKRLIKVGVYRSIDILEVSASIMFSKGVLSCLTYLEAVPWTEEEEEKLRIIFKRFKFNDTTTQDILGRLYSHDSISNQNNLAQKLVWSITASNNANAKNELKSLVKGLLCRSSIYEKDYPDLTKEDVYLVCKSCISSLISLFEEASNGASSDGLMKKEKDKPLIERISRQVNNINWLIEILLDWQMAEDFVDLWAKQEELVKLHESSSPMVRYELNRVTAILFISMSNRKMQCGTESRSKLTKTWFGPMLSDFGWLQRCRKGLDMRALEEAMGQTLLTLPLRQQYSLFLDWFRCFSRHGSECPNLSKAFQIWWRRSFLRGCENSATESR